VTIGVEWNHVYPSVVWKVVPIGRRAEVILVPDPRTSACWSPERELRYQEAITHQFGLPLPRFQRLIKGHPRESE